MSSTKGLVLVTGANGYIAARSVQALLEAGYSVRGTVRSAKSAEPTFKDLPASLAANLSIVEVPNIIVPGAFDEAVKGVDAVAHIAAPVAPNFTDPEPVMRDATQSVARALEAAATEPKVKSFVFMSSLAAIRPSGVEQFDISEENWNTNSIEMVEKMGKQTPGFVIYAASKTASEQILWKWTDEHKPTFTVTALNPCFVAGPQLSTPESVDKINFTSKPIFDVLEGKKPLDQVFPGVQPGFVDVRDVARMVLFTVEHPEKVDGERFLLASAFAPIQAIADIIRENHPEYKDRVIEGNKGEGYLSGYAFPKETYYRPEKSVRVTGQGYIPWEKTVADSIEQFKVFL